MSSKSIYLVWKVYQRRAESLAGRLGLNVIYYHYSWEERSKIHKLFSYIPKSVCSFRDLIRYRPAVYFIQLAPVPLLYVARIYSALTRSEYIADCHNAMIDGISIRFPFVVSCLRNAKSVLVHNPDIEKIARAKGVKAQVLRDMLPVAQDSYPVELVVEMGLIPKKYVIVPWNFASDEPLPELFESIHSQPNVTFALTWFKERLPKSLVENTPPNIIFTGYLDVDKFNALFFYAGAALSLTEREGTQPSAASEAIAFGVPLVVSDLNTTRSLYGDCAVYVENIPESIAKGIARAIDERQWLDKVGRLKKRFDQELEKELDELIEDMGVAKVEDKRL